jgi:hypothetical protein
MRCSVKCRRVATVRELIAGAMLGLGLCLPPVGGVILVAGSVWLMLSREGPDEPTI